MRLIGQFDSPFVRRVAVALRHYSLPFDHSPLAVFADAEQIAQVNPLCKVPTLVLDDGVALTDSFVCLEVIDDLVSSLKSSTRPLLLPRSGPARTDGLRLCGLAAGAAEKAVSLVYERAVRESRSETWTRRCRWQIRGAFELLEHERATRTSEMLVGNQLSHADVMVTCAFTFVCAAHPDFFAVDELPKIRAHAARCETMPEFAESYQPFEVRLD